MTTSKDIRVQGVQGFGQMSRGVLASYARGMDDSSFESILVNQRAAHLRSLELIGVVDEMAIVQKMIDGKPQAQWKMILPDVSEEGKWRTQTFDERGFSGHATFASKDLAIDAAAESDFCLRDDMALDRIQNTPVFQRGLFTTDLLQRANSGLVTFTEADRLLAQYDEVQKALNSISESGAQAFISQDGSAIYLLCDRIDEGSEQAVFLHEIMHRYGKAFVSHAGMSLLYKKMTSWGDKEAGSVEKIIYDKAFARAKLATGNNLILFEEEILAYGVEEAVLLGVKPSAQALESSPEKWLDEVANTLSQALSMVTTGLHLPNAATSAQSLVDLAYAFAQLESPERMTQIMQRLSFKNRAQLQLILSRSAAGPWYSKLQMAIQTQNQERMPAARWSEWILSQTGKGVKPDEIEWSGVRDWLATQSGIVTKGEVLQYLQSNGVRVQEYATDEPTYVNRFVVVDSYGVEQGSFEDEGLALDSAQDWSEDYTRNLEVKEVEVENENGMLYDDRTIPGGKNNKEILLKLPLREDQIAQREAISLEMFGVTFDELPTEDGGKKRQAVIHANFSSVYRSTHWTNHENVLAHLRVNDRESLTYTAENISDIESRIIGSMGLNSSGSAFKRSDLGSGAPIAALRKGVITVVESNQYAHFRNFQNVSHEGATEKILFIEEIQSDYSTDARKLGIARAAVDLSEDQKKEKMDLERSFIDRPDVYGERDEQRKRDFSRLIELREIEEGTPGVPDAPFISSTGAWLALTLKRVVKMAVDGGYDKVAFINGEQSSDRYNLKKKIFSIDYKLSEQTSLQTEKLYDIKAWDSAGETPTLDKKGVSLAEISSQMSKPISEKIDQTASIDWASISGESLEMGGEGMKAFYDTIVPNTLKDVFKRLGVGSIGTVKINEATVKRRSDNKFQVEIEDEVKVFSDKDNAISYRDRFGQTEMIQSGFEVTPQMAEVARFGLPMFSLELMDAVARYAQDADGDASLDLLEARRQCASVVNQFIGTQQWLKSPNGKPTKLTQSQWVLVRTENFKRWFGDWENDPDHASAAVDGETNEPSVLYHGTQKAGFSVFDPGSRSAGYAASVFFTSEHIVARSYAGNSDEAQILDEEFDEDGYAQEMALERGVYPVFLNIRNPNISDFEGANWDGTRHGQLAVEMSPDDEGYEEGHENLIDDENGRRYFFLNERHLAQELADKFEGAQVISAPEAHGTTNSLVEEAKRYKNDGAIIYDVVDEGKFGDGGQSSNVFVVFDGKQIKSATRNVGTFSLSSEDIRYSMSQNSKDENFKTWFAQSKAVDDKGNALILYHGTPNDFSSFDTFPAFFTPDADAAFAYAKGQFARDNDPSGPGPSIMPVHLSLLNPKIYTEQELKSSLGVYEDGWIEWVNFDEVSYALISQGYDGVIIRDALDYSGGDRLNVERRRYDQYVVFKPQQIKSALGNDGSFNTLSSDIRCSMGRSESADANFQKWFGQSKVVGLTGQPLQVYHGTQRDFSSFDPDMQGDTVNSQDAGFFFTNYPKEADCYAEMDWDKENPQPNVMPVYLSLQNPKFIDIGGLHKPGESPGVWYDEYGADAALQAIDDGYDGLIICDEFDPVLMPDGTNTTLFVAFRPEQIKSSIGNNGSFDSRNSDIRFSIASDTAGKTENKPSFHEWIEGSRVVDENGNPLRMYRGTLLGSDRFIDQKDSPFGFHFGGASQARKIFNLREEIVNERDIVPVYLGIKKPLNCRDAGDWSNPFSVWMALNSATNSRLNGLLNDMISDAPKQIRMAMLVDGVKALGFDGVIYQNKIEGAGYNWVAFDDSQIRCAINTCFQEVAVFDGAGGISFSYSPSSDKISASHKGEDLTPIGTRASIPLQQSASYRRSVERSLKQNQSIVEIMAM